MSGPNKTAAEPIPPPKLLFDHETNSTLPNPSVKTRSDGSVMSPQMSVVDLRSKPGGHVAAKDVQPEEVAQHPTRCGAAFANRRAQLADPYVIEDGLGGDQRSVLPRYFEESRDWGDADARVLIAHARNMLVIENDSRVKRKDTLPRSSTKKLYQQKCDLIDASVEAIQDPCETRLKMVMSHYAPRKQSFYVMRAALKWRAFERLGSQLNALDAIYRTDVLSASWHSGLEELERQAAELQQCLELDHAECLAISERKTVGSGSKKNTLRKLKPGWRDVFLVANEHSETYKRAGVLMRFCGLRPAELEFGVHAELVEDKVNIHIKGAKVRQTAGQPWRRFSLHAAALPAWFVNELQVGRMVCRADADNMRQHLARISATLYPRKHKQGQLDVILSAYVFRHALTTDLRAAGWKIEDIAAVLGESAAETANWYGIRPQRGSKNAEPVGIVSGSTETCRAIKSPNRKWLENIPKERRKSTKIKLPNKKIMK